MKYKQMLLSAVLFAAGIFLMSSCGSVDMTKDKTKQAVLGARKEAESYRSRDEASEEIKQAQKRTGEETLGNPRSSYGLGSAAFLKGKNILVSVFVDTPESVWTEEEKEDTLKKLAVAAGYIEGQAEDYGVRAKLVYDWKENEGLKAEVKTDFAPGMNEEFIDSLDEATEEWFEKELSCEALLEEYSAKGCAALIFINNPGESYAAVYDGTDNEKESAVLFSKNSVKPYKEETPAVYAHEILHLFGAHDLYPEAEFTEEVTDYIKLAYPLEIMYTVTDETGSTYDSTIVNTLSPVTAYHLGFIKYTEEIDLFPQLKRN